ncbi:probable serine carboxypeptidase CPVL [Ornithodoros turicata]|uniref:probable serine carboxypeptidase CPVL n=1 Tax=Ornithodoros turicata TaxID=34597 RepID=UPI003138E35C
MFVENGPYIVRPDLSVGLKPSSWITHMSLLYIDNPVGSGFSFTEDSKGYARNEKKIAEDLFMALRQFFVLFPEYQNNDLYLGGQSYAGKYVPALAYRIHTDTDAHWMNLKGMVIGNGYTDPVHMLNYADFLYQVGLVDEQQAAKIRMLQKRVKRLIQEKRWVDAYMIVDHLLVGAYAHSGTLLYNMTGRTHYYNILKSDHPVDMLYYRLYLDHRLVRAALHVGNRTISDGVEARYYLMEDMMQSVSVWVGEICNYYKVLFYTGQLDIIVNYPLVENFLRHLKWKHSDAWKNTKRMVWK